MSELGFNFDDATTGGEGVGIEMPSAVNNQPSAAEAAAAEAAAADADGSNGSAMSNSSIKSEPFFIDTENLQNFNTFPDGGGPPGAKSDSSQKQIEESETRSWTSSVGWYAQECLLNKLCVDTGSSRGRSSRGRSSRR